MQQDQKSVADMRAQMLLETNQKIEAARREHVAEVKALQKELKTTADAKSAGHLAQVEELKKKHESEMLQAQHQHVKVSVPHMLRCSALLGRGVFERVYLLARCQIALFCSLHRGSVVQELKSRLADEQASGAAVLAQKEAIWLAAEESLKNELQALQKQLECLHEGQRKLKQQSSQRTSQDEVRPCARGYSNFPDVLMWSHSADVAGFEHGPDSMSCLFSSRPGTYPGTKHALVKNSVSCAG